MKLRIHPLTALLFVIVVFSTAHAARIQESRSDASHVIVGVVSEVFKSTGETYTGFVVRIRIEAVEKGSGLTPGDFLYTYCFQRNPVTGSEPEEPGARGHTTVPKQGQRIKAFLQRGNGLWEGIYPDWYDVEPDSEAK